MENQAQDLRRSGRLLRFIQLPREGFDEMIGLAGPLVEVHASPPALCLVLGMQAKDLDAATVRGFGKVYGRAYDGVDGGWLEAAARAGHHGQGEPTAVTRCVAAAWLGHRRAHPT
jgi:hypothetical protein